MTEPIRRDLELRRGDTWVLFSPSDGALLVDGFDLSYPGVVVWSTIKRYQNDADPGLSQINSNGLGGVVIEDATHITVEHPQEATDDCPSGDLWYDITVDWAPHRSYVRIYGRIRCVADMTLTAGLQHLDAELAAPIAMPTLVADAQLHTNAVLNATLPALAISATATVGSLHGLIGSDLLYHWEVGGPSSGFVTLAGTDNNQIATLVDRVAGGLANLEQPTAGNRPGYYASGTSNGRPSVVLHDSNRWMEGIISLAAANRVGVFFYMKQPLQTDIPDAAGYILASARSGGGGSMTLARMSPGNRHRMIATFTGGAQDITATAPALTGGWRSIDFVPLASGAVWRIDGVVATADFTGADTMIAADRFWLGAKSAALSGGELAFVALVNLATTDHTATINAYRAAQYQSTDVPVTNRGGWPPYQMTGALYTSGSNCTHWGASDETGKQWVSQYNHTTGVLTRTLVYDALAAELHRCPTIMRRASDGRLITFYSHGPNLERIAIRISTNPDDSTAWGAATILDPGNVSYYYYYLQPFQLTGEPGSPIYLFFKNATVLPAMAQWYMKSTDGGVTWTGLTKVAEETGQRPYMAAVQNGAARVDFLFSRGIANELPAGTGGVYHAYYEGGSYYKTDGTLIGSSAFTPSTDATVIYDGVALGYGLIIDIVIMGGQPVVLYQTNIDRVTLKYFYAKWNGTTWVKTELVTSRPRTVNFDDWLGGGYGCLDPGDPNTCYVGVTVSGQIELWKYVTADGGATFTPTAVTTNSQYINHSPRVPRNAIADLQLLWEAGAIDGYLGFCLSAKSYPAHW
jgi:hypothetical protein